MNKLQWNCNQNICPKGNEFAFHHTPMQNSFANTGDYQEKYDNNKAVILCSLFQHNVLLKFIFCYMHISIIPSFQCKITPVLWAKYTSLPFGIVFLTLFEIRGIFSLTHWGRDKMAAISRQHFQIDFLEWILWISIKMSLKFVPRGPIINIPALVQIMAWRRPGDKPLSEPMMVS